MGDPEIEGVVDDALVLERCEAAVEGRVLRGFVHRRILIHEADLDRIPERMIQPIEHTHAFVTVSRQHEMTHDDTAQKPPV